MDIDICHPKYLLVNMLVMRKHPSRDQAVYSMVSGGCFFVGCKFNDNKMDISIVNCLLGQD